MMQYQKSKTSLFLLEIIINVLFFLLMLSICFQFSANTHDLLRQSKDLAFAQVQVENVANIWTSDSDSFVLLQKEYPAGITDSNSFLLFFDQKQKLCEKENAYYSILLTVQDDSSAPGSMQKAVVSCQILDSTDAIYEISIQKYIPLCPSAVLGGAENE